MLKSIKILFLELLNSFLPLRKNFSVVNSLTEEQILDLPKANHVADCDFINPLFDYKNKIVQALIWELKYEDNIKHLNTIGRMLYEEILEKSYEITLFQSDAEFLLIPIPITTQRRIERGYNQSEYIAKSILQNDIEHNLVYAPQFITKTRNTNRQSHSMSKYERKENIKNSFWADPRVAGKYIFLVDDVVTTGSTLSEARNTLLIAGAKDVFAVTIAH